MLEVRVRCGWAPAVAIPTAIALVCGAAPARPDSVGAGDVATTEQRLQRAGVAPALRLRIHDSVQKGANWLLSRQTAEGAFRRNLAATTVFGSDHAAVEASCALALACAGGKSREEGARRTLRWMAAPDGTVRPEVTTQTRAAAFAAMLVRELDGDADLARRLASAILSDQDPKGGLWSSAPGTAMPFGVIPRSPPSARPPDLAATRDALLGLAAAAACGVKVPPGAARKALASLGDPGGDDAIFLSVAGAMPLPIARSGLRLAALEAARGLARGPVVPPSAEAEIEGTARALRRALGDEAQDGFWCRGKPFLVPAALPPWCWDVAAGAVLAGVAEFDGEPWFPPLAEAILARQNGDGSWGTSVAAFDGDAFVETALAILSLVRAPEPLSRRVAPPAGVAVRGPWPDPEATPPGETVPLESAEEALAWLEGLLADPAARGPEMLRFLLFVGRAYDRFSPGADEKAAEEWRRRAEEAWLRAAVVERKGPGDANEFADANLAAARLLAFARPRVAAPFRRALEREFRRTRDTDVERPFLRAAFASLLRLDRDETLLWLTGRDVLSTLLEEPERVRTQEALRAAATQGRAAGAARREAVERICGAFEGLESAALGFTVTFQPAKPVPRAAERWFSRRRCAIEALWNLGTDPFTRLPPLGAQKEYLLTVIQYRPWLRSHKDLSASPWADR